jgi:hypothetical protein
MMSMRSRVLCACNSTCDRPRLAADRVADRLLRLPLRADRVPGGAQLQHVASRHHVGRVLAALVCDVVAEPGADRRRPAVAAHRRRIGHAGADRRHAGRLRAGPVRPLSDPRRIHRRAGSAPGAAGGDHRPLAAPAVRRDAAGDRLAGGARRRDGDAGARLGLGCLRGGGGAGAAGRHPGRSGGGRDGPLRPALAGRRSP